MPTFLVLLFFLFCRISRATSFHIRNGNRASAWQLVHFLLFFPLHTTACLAARTSLSLSLLSLSLPLSLSLSLSLFSLSLSLSLSLSSHSLSISPPAWPKFHEHCRFNIRSKVFEESSVSLSLKRSSRSASFQLPFLWLYILQLYFLLIISTLSKRNARDVDIFIPS